GLRRARRGPARACLPAHDPRPTMLRPTSWPRRRGGEKEERKRPEFERTLEGPPLKCASFPDEGSSRRDGHRRSFPSEITRYPRKWNDCESVRDGPQERTEIPLL